MLNDDVIRMIVSGGVGATLTAVLLVWFPMWEAMLLVLGFVVADLVEAAAVPLVIGLVKLRRLRRGIP